MAQNPRLTRLAVSDLDALLGHPFKVLDDGFVRVIDYMGSDASVTQAARVSYGEGTRPIHQDEGLIRYLMRHRHTTPFEMCEIKLHVRVPMDCWRQWIRHRTASVNEYSTRYSLAIDRAQGTSPGSWRMQTSGNRQGSDGYLDRATGEELSKEEVEIHEHLREMYERRIAAGVAREQARKDLPLATYTEAYWKIDLHNLLHFLSLRMDSHAQAEIREYASVIGNEILRHWCPITWAAFQDYRRGALVLTARETAVLRRAVAGDMQGGREEARQFAWMGPDGELPRNRERLECEVKFDALGVPLPWKT